MSDDRMEGGEGFLRRWSRLKNTPEEAKPELPAAAPVANVAADEPPPLPNIDDLTPESDFRGFMHPKVDAKLRHAALRKLFSDPHFNVMDGLDVYIDDYSKDDPIPPEMLAGLKQAQKILRWAEGKKDEEEEAQDSAEVSVECPEESQALALEDAANPSTETDAASVAAEPIAVPDPTRKEHA